MLTAHDVLPREPRAGPARRAARGCTSASTRSSCTPSTAARGSSTRLGVDPAQRARDPARRVHAPARRPGRAPLPPRARRRRRPRRAASSACCAPTRASTCCSRPGAGSSGAELWIVGMPRMDMAPLRAAAPPGVRFVERFVTDAELAGVLPPRRPRRAALPRDRPVRRAVHRAGVRRPLVLSDVGGFPEVARGGAAELVPPGDAGRAARRAAGAARRPGRAGELGQPRPGAGATSPTAGTRSPRAHLALYARLAARERRS